MSPRFGKCAQLVALLSLPLSVLAQAPASGLSGVQGGQGGIFTIPYVAAHTLGIPGVTRPMLMAGPVGGLGGVGGGGGGAMVNPNWVGAAGMFMPHLLNGNAAGGGGAAAGAAIGGRTAGGVGSSQEVSGRSGIASAVRSSQAEASAAVDASAAQGATPSMRRPAVIVHVAPVDPVLAEERLLAFQKEQAVKGSPSAQLALARRYSKGQGVEANAAVARVWLEAAARSGSEQAKAELESN
jgi:hypothetical protein